MPDEVREDEMSRQYFQVAYDGIGHDAHSMDVQELAPALMAFGRLIREANFEVNGKAAAVRVLVASDFEHKCFNISFEVVQSILHQVATFLTSEEVKSARQILVDLGIIGGSSGLGLFGYLKWKKGKTVAQLKDSDTKGIIIVQLGDGNFANVNADAIKLASNPKVRSAVEGALAPLGTDGVKKITFKEGDAEFSTFDADEAKQMIASFDIALSAPEQPDDAPDTVTAWLRVYSPVYDEKAEKWRFYYGDHPIYADISETAIARDAIQRGGALVNDLYKVKMEIRQHLTASGNSRVDYKIVRVLDFQPAQEQRGLPFSGPGGA